ncbi:MAG: TIGR02281 family clan AA aspartic protease [Maricaulaceae bacterium]|jgi:aspartyl protease family protein
MGGNRLIALAVGGLLAVALANEFLAEDQPFMLQTAPAAQSAAESMWSAEPGSAPAAEVASLVKEADGHFYAEAMVAADRSSSVRVRFLVDTGASMVALTLDDALRAGVEADQLEYIVPVETASGRTFGAPVRLARLRVAGVELEDVDAIVIERGLPRSLLGMTFLGRLGRLEVAGDTLILRR